mmetsp:Transcript_20138/g.49399  ORF Transcript_20138/g.49399 Transcript_20138/m.49399 type:complete len:210 (-) Transcript_20138:403-1032(-)
MVLLTAKLLLLCGSALCSSGQTGFCGGHDIVGSSHCFLHVVQCLHNILLHKPLPSSHALLPIILGLSHQLGSFFLCLRVNSKLLFCDLTMCMTDILQLQVRGRHRGVLHGRPLMLQRHRSGNTLVRRPLQHLLHQIDSFLWNVILVSSVHNLFHQDFHHDILRISTVVGILSVQHQIQQHTDGPDVDLLSVLLANQLRGKVMRRPTEIV